MRSARPVLVGTCLAAFVATLDNTVVAVALRDLQADLAAGVTGLQGVVTAYAVALAALLLSGGALCDVLGARRTLLLGLGAFAAASAACALAGSVPALVAARAVQGAGAALVLPGSLAVLAAAVPEPAARARAVGLWAATGGAALVAGPLVGGVLVALGGWPAVFWVNLPLCLLVAVVVLRAPLQQAPGDLTGRRGLDLPGQLLAATGLGTLSYAVVVAGRDGLRPLVVGLLAAAAGCATVLVLVERRAREPLLPRGLGRAPGLRPALLGAFAASLAVFLLLVFVSLLLQLVQQREALPAALRLLPLTVALAAVAPLAGRWTAARGPAGPTGAGLLLTAAACAGLSAVLARDLGDLPLALLLALAGAGIGLTGAPVVAAVLDAVARTGLAAGVVTVARELGGVAAVAGLGALAVARLVADLGGQLRAAGVPGPAADAVVDEALRGAPAADVLAAAGDAVPLDVLLGLRAAAEQSFVDSTRVALLCAAVLLAGCAAVCARGLRRP